jgi:hypothetical protein
MKLKLNELKCVYVNLDKETHKNDQIKKVFKNFGFEDVIRISGIPTPENYAIGNTASLLNAVNYYNGNPMLVFEDDAFPYMFVNEIDIPDNADAVWLGYSRWGAVIEGRPNETKEGFLYNEVPGYPHLSKVSGCLTAHAILFISNRFVKDIQKTVRLSIKKSKDKNIFTFFDWTVANLQHNYNIYALNIPAFCQNDINKPEMIDFTTTLLKDI